MRKDNVMIAELVEQLYNEERHGAWLPIEKRLAACHRCKERKKGLCRRAYPIAGQDAETWPMKVLTGKCERFHEDENEPIQCAETGESVGIRGEEDAELPGAGEMETDGD